MMKALSPARDAHEPRDVESRAARGGAYLAVAQGARGLVELAATIVLARSLSPAEFGLFDMILAVTGIADMFKDLGLSAATIQRTHLDAAQVSTLFWAQCAAGLGLGALVAAAAPLLAAGYGRPELAALTLPLAAAIALGALSLQPLALLRRRLAFAELGAIDLVTSLLANACAVLAAWRGWGPWALALRPVVRAFVQGALAFALESWRPSFPRATDARELFRFGAHVSGAQLLGYLERNLDNVLVGRFAGATQLAGYSRAYTLMRVPLDMLNALATIAVPMLSRLSQDERRYRASYEALGSAALLCAMPLAPLGWHTADWLIPALFGESWVSAVPVFRVFALGILVKPIANTASWLWISQGRTEELWRWSLWSTGLAMAAFLAGVAWGSLGVAIAYVTVDALLRLPVLLMLVGRRGPVRSRHLMRGLLPACTCTAAVAVAYPWVARLSPFASSGANVALAGTSSLACGLLVTAATPSGRRVLGSVRILWNLVREERR